MTPSGGQETWNVLLAATACKEGRDESVYIWILSDLSLQKIQLDVDSQG